MPTRSHYLAKVLVERARHQAEANGRAFPADAELGQLVEKVLAVEEGITDSAKVRTVVEALPRTTRPSPRELSELAGFLDRYLPLGS
jgi:hypothetical protein